jgi:hypothetical protein
MRHLHFDSIGGASGDMILGALVDLGVEVNSIQTAIDALKVEGIHLHSESGADHAITGTRVTVHAHDTEHDHQHHHHDEPHAPHRGQSHRNLNDIRVMINAAPLPEAVRAKALEVFERIGVAEAKIHGVPLDQIHFHEVGALDSIADIVGCCFAMEQLKADGLSIGPLPQGHGVIQCAHGAYPNPAPATLELLRGLAVVSVDEPFELVTPTGAALLAAWKTSDTSPAGSRIVRIGYGLGQRALNSRPNVLRATLLETSETDATPTACLLLECNLDDCPPEWIGALTTKLWGAGALDVFTIPIQMKKQRPGALLSVLCRTEDRESMLDLIFTESTTFGVRETLVQRTVLERRTETVTTPYGAVRVKTGRWKNNDVTRAPEMDDCIAQSLAHKVPAKTVYASALQKDRTA